MQACGLVILRKTAGQTSFQALGALKRKLRTTRVGHTGTLDRFAEGVLVAVVGPATRLCPLAVGLTKRYRAVVRFGSETSTLDPEGEVVATAELPAFPRIEKALGSFVGKILQRPPEYSAIHVDGKRAYQRAVEGERVHLDAREVEVFDLSVLGWDPPDLTIDLCCSKGTYVRSIARDLGIDSGSRAHLAKLIRTEVGPFRIDEAEDAAVLTVEAVNSRFRGLAGRLPGVFQVNLKQQSESRFRSGQDLAPSDFDGLLREGVQLVFVPGGAAGDILLGAVEYRRGGLRYLFGASTP